MWLDSKTNSRITLNPTNNCAFLAALRLLRRRGCISEWGYPWAPLIVAAVALAMSGNLWLVRPVRSSIGFAVTLKVTKLDSDTDVDTDDYDQDQDGEAAGGGQLRLQ